MVQAFQCLFVAAVICFGEGYNIRRNRLTLNGVPVRRRALDVETQNQDELPSDMAHRRLPFDQLEPDLAVSIFAGQGSRNPLRRTTLRVDRLGGTTPSPGISSPKGVGITLRGFQQQFVPTDARRNQTRSKRATNETVESTLNETSTSHPTLTKGSGKVLSLRAEIPEVEKSDEIKDLERKKKLDNEAKELAFTIVDATPVDVSANTSTTTTMRLLQRIRKIRPANATLSKIRTKSGWLNRRRQRKIRIFENRRRTILDGTIGSEKQPLIRVFSPGPEKMPLATTPLTAPAAARRPIGKRRKLKAVNSTAVISDAETNTTISPTTALSTLVSIDTTQTVTELGTQNSVVTTAVPDSTTPTSSTEANFTTTETVPVASTTTKRPRRRTVTLQSEQSLLDGLTRAIVFRGAGRRIVRRNALFRDVRVASQSRVNNVRVYDTTAVPARTTVVVSRTTATIVDDAIANTRTTETVPPNVHIIKVPDDEIDSIDKPRPVPTVYLRLIDVTTTTTSLPKKNVVSAIDFRRRADVRNIDAEPKNQPEAVDSKMLERIKLSRPNPRSTKTTTRPTAPSRQSSFVQQFRQANNQQTSQTTQPRSTIRQDSVTAKSTTRSRQQPTTQARPVHVIAGQHRSRPQAFQQPVFPHRQHHTQYYLPGVGVILVPNEQPPPITAVAANAQSRQLQPQTTVGAAQPGQAVQKSGPSSELFARIQNFRNRQLSRAAEVEEVRAGTPDLPTRKFVSDPKGEVGKPINEKRAETKRVPGKSETRTNAQDSRIVLNLRSQPEIEQTAVLNEKNVPRGQQFSQGEEPPVRFFSKDGTTRITFVTATHAPPPIVNARRIETGPEAGGKIEQSSINQVQSTTQAPTRTTSVIRARIGFGDEVQGSSNRTPPRQAPVPVEDIYDDEHELPLATHRRSAFSVTLFQRRAPIDHTQ